MVSKTLKAVVVFCMVVLLSSMAIAGELVINGGFETGDTTGWTVVNAGSGNFGVMSGTTSPISFYTVLAPPAGTYAAMTDQTGGGSHILYQDIAVPLHGTTNFSATIYLHNRNTDYITGADLNAGGPPNQQFRMDIMNPMAAVDDVGSGVLMNVYQTQPGDPLISGYMPIAANLAPFAGQTVRMRFAEVDNMFYFQAGVDEVSVQNVQPSCSITMNVPTSPTNIGTFAPGIFMSYDPMVARPFGLEEAGDILTGRLWLPCWRNGHVDVHLVLDESPYGQYMLSELHQWLSFPANIQPWMTYTDDDVYTELFSLQKSGILPGNYKLDVIVVPSGTAASTIDQIVSGAAAAPYYKWSFTETLP
ncbi:MAG: hypothetical protein AB1306_12085 [Nitrospirota bacterium]